MFAGVGGFDLAFERHGCEIVAHVEIDKHAQAVLRKHWPEAQLIGDVHDVVGWIASRLMAVHGRAQDR